MTGRRKAQLLSAAAALISGAAFAIYFELIMRDAWILLISVILFFFYRQSFAIRDAAVLRPSKACGAVFALALSLAKLELISFHSAAPLWFLLMFAGLYLILSNILAMIYYRARSAAPRSAGNRERDISGRRLAAVFFSSLFIILLCYLPDYLHCFPGCLNPDSYWQLQQAAGLRPLSTHSPLLHTLVIRLFYTLGLKLFDGSQTAAVALYSAAQALCLAAAFSYTVETMYKHGAGLWAIAAALAFYALTPYHGVFSVTMWKDVWFAMSMLTLLTTAWRIIRHYEDDSRPAVGELLLLFISAFLTCMFRNAAIYAVILFAAALFAVLLKKNSGGRRFFKAPAVVLLALILSGVIEGPLYTAMNIGNFGISESLSIPIQQISRTICDGGELSAEQEELLSMVIDVSKISQEYKPHISDDVKRLITNDQYISGHLSDFFRLWVSLGIKYPASYLNAWIDQTIGYWYPATYYTVTPGAAYNIADFDIHYGSLLPDRLERIYTYLATAVENLPFTGLLYSVGLADWLSVFALGLCTVRGKRREKVLFVPVLAVTAGLLVGTPVFAEFRYAYTTVTALPLLCSVSFCGGRALEARSGCRQD